ncbi:glycine betaine/proline transport system permease protein [Paracoccus halophilus]|uniref:Glycine betaine/proline transport system permease protein n=1 Tax=Paracoccus halophilus TaxID=376733 RepID=A0A099EZ40_9RHOB|nr:ABC transporter permease subunit [Paracoccus halophilus]KGJ03243.1 glycine/betaine ABC transporter permease [Paracoccus halophilus]SFA52730.1 glycine betaine/proline transport system permease protein [Paracoccus halophilus]
MFRSLSPAIRAALLTLIVGMVCMLLAPYLGWLQKWPASMTLPATEWIGAAVTWLVELIKPLARWGAWLLSYPMGWAAFILIETPYPLVIAAITALGWHLGGPGMALGVLAGLCFVLFSGYWVQGMTTLSLVMVSVPLALFAGLVTGIVAYRMPALRRPIQVMLDVMQTVPTFAYLTPLLLLLGFGPVVGLIASAIYSAPPMARNVLLGLQRVDPEIRDAALMNGANSWQQLILVELPAASRQMLVGMNQSIMAALSMVIIAAVIGGFDDIGWAVLLTMRKADFGNSLIAGMVIVVFAIMIDRLSSRLAEPRGGHSRKVIWGLLGAGAVMAVLAARWLPAASEIDIFAPLAERTNSALGQFTANHGATLNAIRNNAMIYLLLPLRIGLDHAIVPVMWGFGWTSAMALGYFGAAAALAGWLAWRGQILAALMLLTAAGVVKLGIAHLPWPFVLFAAGALGWVASGWRLALTAVTLLGLILIMGLWEPAMLSVYLSGTAVLICTVLGGAIGLLSAVSPAVWRVVRPVCDLLQTVPLFVFLIPVLMFFQIGEFSALLAICAYAIVPMIRYTHQGLSSTPEELVEAALASGANSWAIMTEVRAPYAAPTILLGLNQTILYAFSMLVIAALIGTTDLGQQVYLALGQGDVGLGVAAGAAMAMLAWVADRLVQAFAEEKRAALGL